MKIEVWSDFVCPFCYIGKRRLEEVLDTFPHKDEVEIVYKSFELDPNASRDTNLSIQEILAHKYRTSVNEAKRMTEGVAQQAAAAGLQFNFDTMIPTNTLDAHRIAKFAETKGKDAKVTESLLKAHFTDSKHIGDHETLTELAVEAGLDRQEVQSILQGNDYTEDVRADESKAREIGVQGVPFFVLNNKYAISGAQSKDVFMGALQKVWEEEHAEVSLQSLSSAEGSVCTDDGCEIPNQNK
ncbi:DsbA family oxidoreductase [Bacillus sp. 165]|uniref:DsbA family oxidoreductase n=1 Tax=Bacillus sp. 165 TaxID=1529117 RepID=UPI001AD9E167|nr:DsbA family oxidoreductase [Bacillus sp. 165]MBO9129260.1 DsbA family oxidoreductase [Bacillus sp. 165]